MRAGLSYKFGAPADVNAAYAKMPSPAIAASWAGFYLGIHGGYGWGGSHFTSRVSTAPPVDLIGPKLRGGLYGGHAGYNWQFDRVVAGLELDLSAASIGGSAQVQYAVAPATFTDSRTPKIEALGSIRARLGWLPIESVLFYGTAGLGWERISTVAGFASVAPAGSLTSLEYDATDRFGWVAGAGTEVLLPGGNWIGRLEYLHYGFGTIARSGVITNAAGTSPFGASLGADGAHMGNDRRWRRCPDRLPDDADRQVRRCCWRRCRMDAIWSELDRSGRISALRFRQGSQHLDRRLAPPGHHFVLRAQGTADRRSRTRGNLL